MFEQDKIKLMQGDCIEQMKLISDESIDLIITSPPYEDISGAGYNAKSKDVLFLKLYSEFLDSVFSEYKRILKPNGVMYINAPAVWDYHGFPTDCWRFYPGAGKALETWGRHNGLNCVVENLKSFRVFYTKSCVTDNVKMIPTIKDGQIKKRVIDKTGFQIQLGLKSH